MTQVFHFACKSRMRIVAYNGYVYSTPEKGPAKKCIQFSCKAWLKSRREANFLWEVRLCEVWSRKAWSNVTIELWPAGFLRARLTSKGKLNQMSLDTNSSNEILNNQPKLKIIILSLTCQLPLW